jgi:leucyl-tRNA synthetase
MKEYKPTAIEAKWQSDWTEKNIYATSNDTSKPKYYALEQFPYPSGEGLHMGHTRVYTIGDVVARFWRMNGHRVLYPMGADAFGLPAENAAIQRGVSPKDWTLNNMEKMKKEQSLMGISYDWDRYIGTCLPEYYKFNQWLFLLFYERGLAYRKKAFVNWCPSCNTVLANEQVKEGLCWRCESEVIKKELEQWFLRITEYAERLLEGLDRLPKWPERVKTMQRNWIGKSEGANVVFTIPKLNDQELTVFTTRPDTLYGVSYLVLAPEHPLVPKLIRGNKNEAIVLNFIEQVKKATEIERTSENTEKIGYPTGASVTHPLTNEQIPIWVANYVLIDYGTGAVMGVPAHDERDFQFAKKYNLPIQTVIQSENQTETNEALTHAFTDDGILVNSDDFNGLSKRTAIQAIVEHLTKIDKGSSAINYRLRDWLISRQRYWGTPIPMIYCESCGAQPVPKNNLPVLLPEDVVFDGKHNPLTTSESFVHTTCPKCGNKARRETDTMDTFVDSSWYFFRFTDPSNNNKPFDSEKVNEWLPVDEYVGGIEHAVLHLLYSRFFSKVLYDSGLINMDEPFKSLLPQGMVLKDGSKMSKSKGNAVNVLEITNTYGADAARLFILFAAPPDRDIEWGETSLDGTTRFLNRVWRLVLQNEKLLQSDVIPEQKLDNHATKLLQLLHQTTKKVTEEIRDRNHFNTAISAIMTFVNALNSYPEDADRGVLKEALEKLIVLLSPIVPHITEELWHLTGHQDSVHAQSWPTFDPALIEQDEVEIAIQINGKTRDRIVIPAALTEREIQDRVVNLERVNSLIEGKTIAKVFVVQNRLVNIVITNK